MYVAVYTYGKNTEGIHPDYPATCHEFESAEEEYPGAIIMSVDEYKIYHARMLKLQGKRMPWYKRLFFKTPTDVRRPLK
jgi:hypothetical protein